MTSQERLERLQIGPFWRLLGIEVRAFETGSVTLSMPVTEQIMQSYGVVHGGALATLVDAAVGVSVQTTLEENEATTTIDLQVMYDRPVEAGVLTAIGTIIKRGGTVVFGEAKIYDEKKRLVVHGSATYMILEHARWARSKKTVVGNEE